MNIRQSYMLLLSINILAALAFGFYSSQLTYMNQLEYNWWFSFSTHFSHKNLEHLVSNMSALFILLWLFPLSFKRYLCGMVLTIITVRVFAGFYNIHSYLGFSAMLFILPGHHLIKLFKTKNYMEITAILIIMLCHLGFVTESWDSEISQTDTFHAAHLIGFIVGSLSYCTKLITVYWGNTINLSLHNPSLPMLDKEQWQLY